MSGLPGVNRAWEEEVPQLVAGVHPSGADWVIDFRDRFPISSDEIHNHYEVYDQGVHGGNIGLEDEIALDWSPYEADFDYTQQGVHAGRFLGAALRWGPGEAAAIQVYTNPAPLAIDAFDRSPDHGQQGMLSDWAWMGELPQDLPFHYDYGDQLDMGQAIGPRMIQRQPPSISDQTATIIAAGF